eukprot:13532-Heterococcus_DN1.PRE.3
MRCLESARALPRCFAPFSRKVTPKIVNPEVIRGSLSVHANGPSILTALQYIAVRQQQRACASSKHCLLL